MKESTLKSTAPTADNIVGMVRYWEKLPPMRWMMVFALLWLLSATAAFAATGKVLRIGASGANIAVTHNDGGQWQVRDRVCVVQLRSTIACGRVVKATAKGAIIKLDAPSSDVIAGDNVVAESQATGASSSPNFANSRSERTERPDTLTPQNQHPTRKPSQVAPKAQLLDSVKKHSETDNFDFNLSGGTSISFSFFYPVVSLQYAVNPHWAIGLSPMLLFAGSNGASLFGFGGYGTVNYYGQGNFRGLWVQGGAGLINFAVSGGPVTESANTLAAIGTVGWRGYWDLGLNIGVGAGLQYIQDPAFTSITVESAGFLPLVMVDVGFNW